MTFLSDWPKGYLRPTLGCRLYDHRGRMWRVTAVIFSGPCETVNGWEVTGKIDGRTIVKDLSIEEMIESIMNNKITVWGE